MVSWAEQTEVMESKMINCIMDMQQHNVLSLYNKPSGAPIVSADFIKEFDERVDDSSVVTITKMLLEKITKPTAELHYYIWVLSLLPPFEQLDLLGDDDGR